MAATQAMSSFAKVLMQGGGPSPSSVAMGLGVAATLYAGKESVLFTNAGYIYVIQNNISGSLTVKSEPGITLRAPFFSSVTMYKQIVTTSFEDKNRTDTTIRVRFADTYIGQIPATFRFKLPLDEMRMKKIHKDFRSEMNLTETLLDRNARDVTVVTATQYTGEEFFQGGLNQFKNQLQDQLTGGIYETERKQVEVEATELAPVGMNQKTGGERSLHTTKQLVWKTVPILDDAGKEKRVDNPLAQYGLSVTQVLLTDPRPEVPNKSRLEYYIQFINHHVIL